jgi:hypothetical protein
VTVAAAATTLSIPAVLEAIRHVESNGNPYVIRDNSGNRAYFPQTLTEAVSKAKELLALHHNIDLGLYQINSIHLTRPGVSIDNIFDTGVQASLASQIFNEFYTQSKAVNGDTDTALWRAVGAYNMGTVGLYRDNVPYNNQVLAAMGLTPKPEIGGAWTQGGAPRLKRNPLFNPTRKFQVPGEWRLGDPISLDPADAEEDDAKDTAELSRLDQAMADAVAVLLVVVLLLLLAKVGLLFTVVKFVANHAAAAAARQMFKRRQIPSS